MYFTIPVVQNIVRYTKDFVIYMYQYINYVEVS